MSENKRTCPRCGELNSATMDPTTKYGDVVRCTCGSWSRFTEAGMQLLTPQEVDDMNDLLEGMDE